MISTGGADRCGKVALGEGVIVLRICEAGDTVRMNILSRLITIAMRKFEEHPSEREPATRMIVLNAVRLSVAILGAEKTKDLTDKAMRRAVH